MKSFACPHNKEVRILSRCCIDECPFHAARVNKFFTFDVDTGCSFYDSNLMANDTPSRTQISALSRDESRVMAPSLIRSIYAEILLKSRVVHRLTHEVNTAPCCERCGYPKKNCVSSGLCGERNAWVTSTLIHTFKMDDPSLNTKALVWRMLIARELHLEFIFVKNGMDLCAAADLAHPAVQHAS